MGQISQRAINAKLVIMVLAMPLILVIGLHAIAIADFLVGHAQAILTCTGAAITGFGGLLYLASLWAILGCYDRGVCYDEEERDTALFGTSICTLMISGGIVLILRGNIWDATGAAITNAGTLAIVQGLTIVLAGQQIGVVWRIPSFTMTGQLVAMFGAVPASAGIVVLCRTQLV